jgi:hypothetical protein
MSKYLIAAPAVANSISFVGVGAAYSDMQLICLEKPMFMCRYIPLLLLDEARTDGSIGWVSSENGDDLRVVGGWAFFNFQGYDAADALATGKISKEELQERLAEASVALDQRYRTSNGGMTGKAQAHELAALNPSHCLVVCELLGDILLHPHLPKKASVDELNELEQHRSSADALIQMPGWQRHWRMIGSDRYRIGFVHVRTGFWVSHDDQGYSESNDAHCVVPLTAELSARLRAQGKALSYTFYRHYASTPGLGGVGREELPQPMTYDEFLFWLARAPQLTLRSLSPSSLHPSVLAESVATARKLIDVESAGDWRSACQVVAGSLPWVRAAFDAHKALFNTPVPKHVAPPRATMPAGVEELWAPHQPPSERSKDGIDLLPINSDDAAFYDNAMFVRCAQRMPFRCATESSSFAASALHELEETLESGCYTAKGALLYPTFETYPLDVRVQNAVDDFIAKFGLGDSVLDADMHALSDDVRERISFLDRWEEISCEKTRSYLGTFCVLPSEKEEE